MATPKYKSANYIQLFRERLSEKEHATIPKGIVGGFQFTVLQRNLKEWHEWVLTYVCECQRKATKVGRQLECQEQCIDHIPYDHLGLSRAHFFRQPFGK